jgi:hypothetical protein
VHLFLSGVNISQMPWLKIILTHLYIFVDRDATSCYLGKGGGPYSNNKVEKPKRNMSSLPSFLKQLPEFQLHLTYLAPSELLASQRLTEIRPYQWRRRESRRNSSEEPQLILPIAASHHDGLVVYRTLAHGDRTAKPINRQSGSLLHVASTL